MCHVPEHETDELRTASVLLTGRGFEGRCSRSLVDLGGGRLIRRGSRGRARGGRRGELWRLGLALDNFHRFGVRLLADQDLPGVVAVTAENDPALGLMADVRLHKHVSGCRVAVAGHMAIRVEAVMLVVKPVPHDMAVVAVMYAAVSVMAMMSLMAMMHAMAVMTAELGRGRGGSEGSNGGDGSKSEPEHRMSPWWLAAPARVE
jgi:hypothetical protein